MNELFELEHIEVVSAGYTILEDISVSFPEGVSTFIIGKAGSGKSTLLKTLAGLIVPEKGRVLYRGKNIGRHSKQEELAFRYSCAFAFQDAALWANQSIYNNISLPLALHEPGLKKKEADRRIVDAVRRAGYSEGLGFRPDALSAGEQKLISFARCLVLDPMVLFMDEPTASLDEESVDNIVSILKELKAAGKTLITVSHDPRLIAELADQLLVIADGKILGRGSVASMAPLVGAELARRIRQAKKAIQAVEEAKETGKETPLAGVETGAASTDIESKGSRAKDGARADQTEGTP